MKPGILQLVDSLATGGTERVAVNVANALPRDGFRSFLCATRAEGPLRQELAADVGYLYLRRRARWDPGALRRLRRFVAANQIGLIHAHSSSLFLAVLASLLPPFPKILWHDHFGRGTTEKRSPLTYRLLAHRVSGVISVNQDLAAWARQTLRVPAERVWQIPNFVIEFSRTGASASALPGTPGFRFACVANFRHQKDHATLLQAFQRVRNQCPEAHLLLAGGPAEPGCLEACQEQVRAQAMQSHVTFLGASRAIAPLLRGCDIGVLSSVSEGFPLVLLEYGNAGLAVVATRVGQCPEILNDGLAGLLVPPRDPEALAEALLRLLRSAENRAQFAGCLRQRIQDRYSPTAVMHQVTAAYGQVLTSV